MVGVDKSEYERNTDNDTPYCEISMDLDRTTTTAPSVDFPYASTVHNTIIR